jgi:AcrR family transcriptional regulator
MHEGLDMAEATHRERSREDTETQIRTVARTLLVSRGREAVTLRAIARELGITAPALYRYYDSFEDLLRHVCIDICADLAADIDRRLAPIPETDGTGRVFAVCRGFRSWAIEHPREFTLVFADPAIPKQVSTECGQGADPFGQIFLGVAGNLLATGQLTLPGDAEVPDRLRDDLSEFRRSLFETLAEVGVEVPDELFSLGAAYTMLRFWVRLYGQVALEVFGRFPFAVSEPEALFESMLAELATEVGLTET